MRRMLVSRISRRVLAEHHIALSKSFSEGKSKANQEPHVGIISTELNIKESIERCARLLAESPLWSEEAYHHKSPKHPNVIIEGHTDTKFAYIREHFEYVPFMPAGHLLTMIQIHHF